MRGGVLMKHFAAIRARAAKRKGGDAELNALLPKVKSASALARMSDDRLLSDMTKRIFSAGFAWSVIEKKWPGFEAAFLGFEPKRLLAQPDEFWEKLASDPRIVRNAQKIMAVRGNAQFIADVAKEKGSFGKFLAAWPPTALANSFCALSVRTVLSCRWTWLLACAMPGLIFRRIRVRRKTFERYRNSSTPGSRRPGCP
jgi:3-methyladenine DNA glycosylase Tag